MTTFGVTPQGFVLKRLNDIQSDLITALSAVTDPVSGQGLTVDLADENDPLTQVINAFSDGLSECWEQAQATYNAYDPLLATGNNLAGLVQLNGIIKTQGQTDSSLLATQQSATATTSQSTIESIYSNLITLPGVTFCAVSQNSSLGTDARGIPGKSIAAVVVGGNNQDIIDTLFRTAPTGALFCGNLSGYYTDQLGVNYPVAYSTPILVPIYVQVNLHVTDSNAFPGDAATRIENALVAYAAQGASSVGINSGYNQLGFIPGYSVEASELYLPVNSIPGMNITSLLVGSAPGPSGNAVAIAWNQQASFVAANISVVVA